MSKPCEYCGCDLPLGVDRRTRRIRSHHFAVCERRPNVPKVPAAPYADMLAELKADGTEVDWICTDGYQWPARIGLEGWFTPAALRALADFVEKQQADSP